MSKKLLKSTMITLSLISAGTTVAATANTAQAATPYVQSTSGTYNVTANALNVRTGAGITYNVLGTLKINTQVTGTVTNGWLKISSGPYIGRYVSASYLKIANTANTTLPNTVSNPYSNNETGQYAVTNSSLATHYTASTYSNSPGSVSQNAILSGTIVNGWLKISTGYYSGDYVPVSGIKHIGTAVNDISATNAEANLRSSVIQIASSQAGVNYVWGGSSTSGFDCSGLTSWVYKQLGMSIPRTAQMQADASTAQNASTAKTGDFVFLYDSTGHVYHVGLLVNAVTKSYWNAPNVGQVVKLGSYSYTNMVRYGSLIKLG